MSYRPRLPEIKRTLNIFGSSRDSLIQSLRGIAKGCGQIEEELATGKAQVRERLDSGEIGPVGAQKEVKALIDGLRDRVAKNYVPHLERARNRVDQLTQQMRNQRGNRPTEIPDAIAYELTRDRFLRRFEGLDTLARRVCLPKTPKVLKTLAIFDLAS